MSVVEWEIHNMNTKVREIMITDEGSFRTLLKKCRKLKISFGYKKIIDIFVISK